MRTIKQRPQVQGEQARAAAEAFQPPAQSGIRPAPQLDDPLANFIGDVNKPRRKASPGSKRKEHIAAIEDRIKRQDWNNVPVAQLVALYWVCHVKIYGVPPAELDSAAAWALAMKRAGLLVQKEFEGDVQRAVNFMRWVWTREREREEWRKTNKIDGRRITWQQQFIGLTLVTDWRAAKVRAGA